LHAGYAHALFRRFRQTKLLLAGNQYLFSVCMEVIRRAVCGPPISPLVAQHRPWVQDTAKRESELGLCLWAPVTVLITTSSGRLAWELAAKSMQAIVSVFKKAYELPECKILAVSRSFGIHPDEIGKLIKNIGIVFQYFKQALSRFL
jgi:hypothetical protein